MRRTTFFDQSGTEWHVEVPETLRERMRGLLGAPALAPNHAMLIERCRSVHTFGMRFPIEVAFLDGSLQVLEVRHMRPWRLTRPRLRARHVLECPSGTNFLPNDRFHEVGAEPSEPETRRRT